MAIRIRWTFIILIAALLLALIIVAGCKLWGNDKPTVLPPESAAQNELSGEISIWVWGPQQALLKSLAIEFNHRHPNVHIDVIDHTRRDAIAMLNNGLGNHGAGLPDVVVADDSFPAFVNKFPQGFVDISDRMGKYNTDFVRGFRGLLTYKERWFAVPWLASPVALYYQTSMLPESFSADNLKEWSKILQNGNKLSASGKALLPINMASSELFRLLMLENDCGIFDMNGNITVSSDRAVAALSVIKSLQQQNLLLLVNNDQDIIENCRQGKLAAVIAGPEFGGMLKSKLPEQAGKWQITTLPAYYAGGPVSSGNSPLGLAITAYSKNQELAWEFVKFCAIGDGAEYALLNFSFLPANHRVYSNEELENDDYFVNNRWGVFFWTAENPVLTNYTADYVDSERYLLPAVKAAIVDNEDSAKALRTAAEDIANNSGRRIEQ